MSGNDQKNKGSDVRITVLAKPKAKRSAILRATGLEVDVAIAAQPVDGAANEELVRILAESLGLPKRALRLAQGASSKRKVVEASGIAVEDAVARLDAAARRREGGDAR